MDWLERNKGQKEIPGHEANPFIVDLFRYTSLWGNDLSLSDETAWCAALACAALEKNGYMSPRSAAASAFKNFGVECEMKYGAILTFNWGGGGKDVELIDHVSFYSGKDVKGRIKCLGGNQSNTLRDSYFQIGRAHV